MSGGQFWMPITPERGSIFHAELQREKDMKTRICVPAVALAAAMLLAVSWYTPARAEDRKVTTLDRFRMGAFCTPVTPVVSVNHRKVPEGWSPPNKQDVLDAVVRKLRLARLYSPDSPFTRLRIRVKCHSHALAVGVALYKALSDGKLLHNERGQGKQGKNFNVGYTGWATPTQYFRFGIMAETTRWP